MKRQYRFLLAALCLGMLAAMPLAADSGNGKMLIYVEESEFRTELAERIIGLAGSSADFMVVSDMKGFKQIEPSDYSAIIVINEGKAGRANRGLIRRISRHAGETRFVIVTSYANPGSAKDDYSDLVDVDGITTASLTDGDAINDLAIRIWNMID